tara:strand:- start:214 stop:789 length:576 start_codon:yes stop_codon:yes gene_type:complete
MSKDTVLKKDFQEQDVQRLRNLVQGKYGEKTRSSVGFSKPQEFHSEGDIWESDGRKWTIKDGIKQNITKLDSAKKAHVVPLLCPKCKTLMKKRVDKKYYNVYKFCLNCYARFEDKLKADGKYHEYFAKVNNEVIDHRIKEFKEYVTDKLNESNNSFVSEDGDVENWVGKVDTRKVEENVRAITEHLESLKT